MHITQQHERSSVGNRWTFGIVGVGLIVASACGGDPVTEDGSATPHDDAGQQNSGDADANSTTGTDANTDASSAPPTFTFTTFPFEFAKLQSMTPLGNMNPPAHTFPTDHIYLFHHVGREGDAPYDVFAPAEGTVVMVQREADDAVYIASSSVHTYFIGHMLVDKTIVANQHIAAGQKIGTTGPISHALDLGVLNSSRENAFINPDRYGVNSRRSEAPFTFFSQSLKDQLGPLVTTTPENREGNFVFDRAGTLSGNWFHETLAISESVGPAAGPKHIAFVRDIVDPSRRVVSMGGTVGKAGVYFMETSDPDPTSVTPSSGPVTLHLSNMQQGTTGVPMVVTLTAADRIRVQFEGADEAYTR